MSRSDEDEEVTDEDIRRVLGRPERAWATVKRTRPPVDEEVETIFGVDGGVLARHCVVCVRARTSELETTRGWRG
jgi:hypothetical protein